VSLQLEYGFARTSKDIDSDLVVDVSIGIDDPLNQQINWMLDILRSIEACNLGNPLSFESIRAATGKIMGEEYTESMILIALGGLDAYEFMIRDTGLKDAGQSGGTRFNFHAEGRAPGTLPAGCSGGACCWRVKRGAAVLGIGGSSLKFFEKEDT
jgi:hypothetical protein